MLSVVALVGAVVGPIRRVRRAMTSGVSPANGASAVASGVVAGVGSATGAVGAGVALGWGVGVVMFVGRGG